ncbi:hypothetical protein TNIN_132621 [Trichonephila inaurata madagascariensis]|uniref:Uncharacterized protein n=1 Tax=Trichonephila inaurata madagascariensis TaxID=2747483 RepID=A0A8X7CN97_9ARAC|nr:hypothetical protein TNIN_132621 [Trichonephila inaurata madagascariensis]
MERTNDVCRGHPILESHDDIFLWDDGFRHRDPHCAVAGRRFLSTIYCFQRAATRQLSTLYDLTAGWNQTSVCSAEVCFHRSRGSFLLDGKQRHTVGLLPPKSSVGTASMVGLWLI